MVSASKKENQGIGIDCTILIPIYNERERLRRNLGPLASAIRKQLPGRSFEILLIENGSTDGNLSLPAALFEENGEVRMESTSQKGRGVAFKRGLELARGRYICVLSVDRAWNESFLGQALELIEKTNVDVVYGQKSHPDSVVDRPLHRTLSSWLIRLLNLILFRIPVQDTQCIKLFRKDAVSFKDDLGPHNYFAETEFFLRAREAGLRTTCLPVTVHAREGGTKVRWYSLFEFIQEALSYRRARRNSSKKNHP